MSNPIFSPSRNAVKFELPDNGAIIDREKSLM